MNLHANAALSLKGRRELCRVVVERERTLAQAAEAAGVSVRCARKWVGRYRGEGEAGLRDRSSAPYRIGITVQQLLTDNGGAYRSTIHAIACRALGVRHLRTRAYRPQTNGKAERFIRTLTAGWAYGAIYRTSAERTAALDGWLWH